MTDLRSLPQAINEKKRNINILLLIPQMVDSHVNCDMIFF